MGEKKRTRRRVKCTRRELLGRLPKASERDRQKVNTSERERGGGRGVRLQQR